MCYFGSVLKKSSTWLYLIQLHRITPQAHQMLKQPSCASLNYFLLVLQALQGWRPSHFSGGKLLACCFWSQSLLWIILSVMGQHTHTHSLKCLSLLVFHGKTLFCLVWFNAFSLFPFNWCHLESLEMVSEALIHT